MNRERSFGGRAAAVPTVIDANAPTAPRTETPWRLPGNDLVIGYDERGRAVVLPYQERARHVYIPGRTGTGKSRMLASMIRQDIGRHTDTGCGLVVFDLHGELVNSVLAVLACDVRSRDLPVVVIDVGNRESVVRWNPLAPHKNVDSAVSAKRMAEAVTHASGGLDLMQSPTLQRTMTTFFHVGTEQGLAIPELFDLADPAAHERREDAARAMSDVRTRKDLLRMNGLSKPRLEDELLAIHNRLSSLTGSPHLRAMMSGAGRGFRFADALEGGWIVLVNLAPSGGTLAETDARVIASLMLTELWQAAQSRGKGAAGERRPFYVYLDEAPFIATPTIALQLAQARGFGLHFTIAAQATSQFEDFGGSYGRAIRKAVLRDTLTKILLAQTADEDDIRPLARELALAYYDPRRTKHVTTSYHVVGEEKEEYWTISTGTATGSTKGTSTAYAVSKQRSRSNHWSTSETSGGGSGSSSTYGFSDSVVTTEALAEETHPERYTHVDSAADTRNDMETWSHGTVEGGAKAEGEGKTRTRGVTKQSTSSTTTTKQQHFRWRPIIETEEMPQFLSFDDHLHICEKQLFALCPGHALLSRQGTLAVEIATPTVSDPDYVDPEWVTELLGYFSARHGLATPLEALAAANADRLDEASAVTRLTSYGRRRSTAASGGKP